MIGGLTGRYWRLQVLALTNIVFSSVVTPYPVLGVWERIRAMTTHYTTGKGIVHAVIPMQWIKITTGYWPFSIHLL